MSQTNQITDSLKDELAGRAEHIRKIRDCAAKHATELIQHIIFIGRNLVEAKEICPHGEWLPWLEREFDWSQSTAERFMQVYRKKDEIPHTVTNFNISLNTLYLLTAPGTPPEARQEIKERVESGEHVSAAQVKETIAEAKQATLEHGRKQVARLQKHYGDLAGNAPPIQYDLLDQVKPTILQMNRPTKDALATWFSNIYRD